MSISSFNSYIEMAAPLNGLISDGVYGSWILSLSLFTLDISYNTGIRALPDIYALALGRRAYISGKALLSVL